MSFSFKKRILYVDDSEDDCDLLSVALEKTLYETKTALTVTDGLRLAQTHTFDLYLLDLRLPDGTGFELFDQIRAFDPFTPIILLSANALRSIQQQSIQIGAQAFFAKPIDYNQLAIAIDRILCPSITISNSHTATS